MDTRIQFRVNEETKRLAQQMAESQGRTLSDACRELTEQQRKVLSHDAWLTEQVNLAFEKYDQGKSVFIEHQVAKSQMEERKAKIRNRGNR
ncbi:damage-inducible protein J [Photobacterium damselae]|uniref:damage-inducible protein J n=1 Tax=Photobacterium damselae TaxID=38293 RepID=UPI002542E947|nr:damage-inducible protein J [Photobacterium damselae]